MHHARGDPRHFRQQRHRLDLRRVLELRDAFGDVLGVVADALDNAGDLERCDNITQIAGHRRAQRDKLYRPPLRFDLQHVELLVVGNDALRPFGVALPFSCC